MTLTPNLRPAQRADPASDAELLVKVSAGDLTALGVLYDRHARHVWRVLHRVMNGGQDVDDVLHATFLQLPKFANNFDGRSPSCRHWLSGVATRLALRNGRGLRRFIAMLSRFGSAPIRAATSDPESQTIHREELEILTRALALLSPKKRAVFVLIEIEGLSHAEVAETLHVPLATVRTRLFGAKAALRKALVANEQTEGGAAKP
jgi:RNA polymerase sigma-70 factor, ECF subfamily